MRDNALEVSSGSPPGGLHGSTSEWRAATRVLQSSAIPIVSAFDDLLSTFFPADCRACGGPLLRGELSPVSLPVCGICLDHLHPQAQSLSTALCRCCGEALGMESDRFAEGSSRNLPLEGLLCTPCRMVPPPFERAVAYGVYETGLREMLHLLKYDRVHSLAKPLGARLAEAVLMLEGPDFAPQNMTVIAVPLFVANQRQRGFNQSLLLADEAISRLKKLRPKWRLAARHSLLRRIKPTESQFNLSARGRRRNLVGAFQVQDDRSTLIGRDVLLRDVLLIDDIYTTGATSRACAQVLRRAGAKRVWVATLARAQREAVALWDSSADDFG